MAKIKVIKNKERPEPTPVLAEAIIKISKAMDELAKNGLNENAVIVLTYDACGMVGSGYPKRKPSKTEIRAVFKALKQLRAWYCK